MIECLARHPAHRRIDVGQQDLDSPPRNLAIPLDGDRQAAQPVEVAVVRRPGAGRPGRAVPLALLFFTGGVGAGQLLFSAAVGVVIVVARHLPLPQPAWAWRVPAYGIGAVAAFWTIERVAAFWS